MAVPTLSVGVSVILASYFFTTAKGVAGWAGERFDLPAWFAWFACFPAEDGDGS